MKTKFLFVLLLLNSLWIAIAKEKQQPTVDFKTAQANIHIDASAKQVAGTISFSVNILASTEAIFIDAKQMQIDKVLVNDQLQTFDYDKKKIWIKKTFKKGEEYTIAITYSTSPKKAMYFVKDEQGNDQIWTQGQGKDTSNWLPSFDDMNEKLTFDLTITYAKGYEVIANGKLITTEEKENELVSWQYDMQHPMSSYLVAVAIGKYAKETAVSKNGTPLTWYYYPEDKDKVVPTYKHSTSMFDFLEQEIGVRYPWQNYKQVPVKDFLYAGMENTGTTIFSDAFMVDEIGFKDRNYINVNAHELAHQWFGDLVTETSGTHHWLQEGFATYYALVAEREIFGEDYFYYKLYESAEQLTALSQKGKATSLLDPKASSLTFYQRGAWALVALEEKVGSATFKKSIQEYLTTYRYQNVTTADFIKIVAKHSKLDLSTYQEKWLKQVAFPSAEALKILEKSAFIKQYLTLAQERTQPLIGKWKTLANALRFPVNDYLGQEVINQLAGDTSKEALALYQKAFESGNTFVLQSIAATMNKIPKALQSDYENILKSESYAAIEPALYHLWANFPQKRVQYLEETKTIIGFNDKNVRILWLVLALNTSGYDEGKQKEWFQELTSYTTERYGFNTRRNAFEYLENLEAFTEVSLKSLAIGTQHHNWRFRKSCRAMIDRLIQNQTYKKEFIALSKTLNKEESEYLKKKLN